MSDDLLRYDILVQDALRGAVKKILTETARAGLPGDHHFYITFDTTVPGVRVSSRLRERYPKEMTIIIQHQYWDLEVSENSFQIGLAFSGIPEVLLIPLASITSFVDPSVEFGLQFDIEKSEIPVENEEAKEDFSDNSDVTQLPLQPEKPTIMNKEAIKQIEKDPEPLKLPKKEDGADVVSLDAFRNKES